MTERVHVQDGDYVLADGAAWLEVKNFAIRVYSTDEGVVVDVYKNGDEINGVIASAYAFDQEALNVADQ